MGVFTFKPRPEHMDPFKEARADIVTDFIEAAIHSILYVRGVYPAAIFKPRRKYGAIVQMCCHADINQYIIKSLKTVHSLLLENALDKVEVALMSNNAFVEIFKFILKLPDLTPIKKDAYLLEVEESLRSALLKISVSDIMCKPRLQGLSDHAHSDSPPFTIFVHTEKSKAANLSHQQEEEGFPWIQVDPQEYPQTSSSSSHLPVHDNMNLLPIKSISNEMLKMEVQLATKEK